MVDKYLKIDASGFTKEVTANDSTSGVSDAGKIVALNSSGVIDPTMLGTTETLSVVSSENLAAGDFVNIWDNAGTANVRKATNTGIATKADGYVKASVTSPAAATVYRDNGVLTGLTSLTVGANYFLGTAGAVTTTIPTGSSSIVQAVGKAKSATELVVNINDPIIRV